MKSMMNYLLILMIPMVLSINTPASEGEQDIMANASYQLAGVSLHIGISSGHYGRNYHHGHYYHNRSYYHPYYNYGRHYYPRHYYRPYYNRYPYPQYPRYHHSYPSLHYGIGVGTYIK